MQHRGPIDVAFDSMPSIRLESYSAAPDSDVRRRLAIATRRRRFSLREDWRISLTDVGYSPALNGTVEIPAKGGGDRTIVFDGASIPLPWLVSLLTIGILRPLGVMLVGSIVHDYAYQHGTLRIARDGRTFEAVPVPRHEADALFRDIIGTVNGLPFVGRIGYFFVRIGWLWVRYDGKRFGGKAPVIELIAFAVLLLSLVWLCATFGTATIGGVAACLYAVLYLSSLSVARPPRLDG